jgi:RimJ/RimL family protein N-acetyltransferase
MPRDWRPGSPAILQTERFTLRSMTRLQASHATYAWTFDAGVMHPLCERAGTWTRYSWYKRHKRYNNRRRFFFGIYVKDGYEMIGFEEVNLTPPGAAFLIVAIGNRDWWGRGVVHETRRALIEFLFDKVGCHRVWGNPAARNFASVFNYQALGFKHEGVLRRHAFDHTTQESVDSLVFGLLRDEWLARRAIASNASQPSSACRNIPGVDGAHSGRPAMEMEGQ